MGSTVSERLIAGTVALIEADGGRDLSVRRLAEASERSTMCVYTHFQGRANLLAAAHREAAGELWSALETTPDPRAALEQFAQQRPRLLLWLLTADAADDLVALRAELATRLLERLDDGAGRARDHLASVIGEAVLAPLLPRRRRAS